MYFHLVSVYRYTEWSGVHKQPVVQILYPMEEDEDTDIPLVDDGRLHVFSHPLSLIALHTIFRNQE